MSFTDLHIIYGLLRDEFILTETCDRKHRITVAYIFMIPTSFIHFLIAQ